LLAHSLVAFNMILEGGRACRMSQVSTSVVFAIVFLTLEKNPFVSDLCQTLQASSVLDMD
jgi:hypothetical protein